MGNFEVPAVRYPVYETCVGCFIQIIVLFVHPEKSPGGNDPIGLAVICFKWVATRKVSTILFGGIG